jgi:tetratricopeptide (TPR) repeat protein
MSAADPQADPLWQRAEAHASRREWAEAIAAFEALLARRPGDARVLVQLSYVHSLAGHYRAARDHALRANDTGTRDPAVIRELVARLRTFNAADALHACVQRLGPPSGVPIPMLLACAAQYSYLNEQERALALLDEAKRGDPDFPPSLLARSQILMYLGRFDEAEADARRATQRAPEIAQGWWLLSRLRKQAREANCVDAIRRELQRPGRRPADVALLAEALHKALDDLGDIPGAWAALELMCRTKRGMLDYSADESRALVDALIAMPVASAPLREAGQGARTPIFIVGMHRSGTTLLEQLLDGHPDVRGVGELYDFTSQMRLATDHHCRGVIDRTIVARADGVDFAEVGAGYLRDMAWRLGPERCFTDKLPSNFLNLGFICRALPQARILHMVRDPVETCFSNLRELFSEANPYSYDQGELADFHAQYRRLMAHWKAAYPGRILDVDYASLTRDTEGVLRDVSAFCGLGFDAAMLAMGQRKRGVATASAVQVRQGVVARETPKWAPYAEYLQPMIRALGAED